MESNKILKYCFILIALAGCQSTTKEDMDNLFYKESHRDDLVRIPLIKPMEVISADKGSEWVFRLPYGQVMDKEIDISGIDLIGVSGSFVVIHSSRMYFDSGMREVWFVIDTAKQTETAITDEQEYNKYISENNLKSLKLMNINEVFLQFDTNGQLPWDSNNHPE